MLSLWKQLQGIYQDVPEVNLETFQANLAKMFQHYAIVPGGADWFIKTAARLIAHSGGEPVDLSDAVSIVFAGDHGANVPIAKFGDASLSLPVPGLGAALLANVNKGTIAGWIGNTSPVNIVPINVGLRTKNLDGLSGKPIAYGTENYLDGKPAMSVENFLAAIQLGYDTVSESRSEENLIFVGEIGLSNTVSTALVLYSMLHDMGLLPREDGEYVGLEYVMTTGAIPDPSRKDLRIQILKDAIPDIEEQLRNMHPIDALRHFGGYEMAAMVGAYLAVPKFSPVVVGGVISTVCVMIANYINPNVMGHMVGSTISTQPNHQKMLKIMGVATLLTGIGTGEAAAELLLMPYLRISADLANDFLGVESSNPLLTMGQLMGDAAKYASKEE